MWVAVILGAWFATSLLLGPGIGRFIADHARTRENAASPAAKSQGMEQAAQGKPPIRIVRQA